MRSQSCSCFYSFCYQSASRFILDLVGSYYNIVRERVRQFWEMCFYLFDFCKGVQLGKSWAAYKEKQGRSVPRGLSQHAEVSGWPCNPWPSGLAYPAEPALEKGSFSRPPGVLAEPKWLRQRANWVFLSLMEVMEQGGQELGKEAKWPVPHFTLHILSAHYFQKPNLSLPAENSESTSPSQSDINVHRPIGNIGKSYGII